MKDLVPDGTDACGRMKVFLSGLIDHELDAEDELAVLAHLQVCGICRAERREIETLSRGLRDAGRSASAPPPWEAVARSLAARGGRRERWLPPRLLASSARWLSPRLLASSGRRFPARRLSSYAAAAVLILLALGGGVLFLSTRRADPARMVAAGVTTAIISGLVDPAGEPDLASLGTARALDRGELQEVRRQVSFMPLVPETLPDGYAFDRGWVISSETCRMVCLRYRRNGRFLAILQTASGGTSTCSLANPQCCLIAGLACRRVRIDRVDVVQTTRGSLALTVAVPAGETNVEALMASLAGGPPTARDEIHRE